MRPLSWHRGRQADSILFNLMFTRHILSRYTATRPCSCERRQARRAAAPRTNEGVTGNENPGCLSSSSSSSSSEIEYEDDDEDEDETSRQLEVIGKIFWTGEGSEQLIATITPPNTIGTLKSAGQNLNGPSGRALDEHILEPLGLTRKDAWLCASCFSVPVP